MRATLLRSLVPGCGLALAGLGLALALQPVRFGATARLLPEAILAVDAETGDYDPHFFQNQLELVKSPTVLTDAVQRLQAQPIDSMELRTVLALNPAEAARFLGNCITLRPVRGTWLLEIGAVVREPHEAAAVANAVAEAYRDQSAVLWNAKRPRLKETWEKRLAQYPELQAAHRRVAALLKDLKVSAHEYHEVELRNQMGWDHFRSLSAARAQELAPLIEAQHDCFQRLLALNGPGSLLIWDFNDLSLRSAIEFPDSPARALPPVKILDPAVQPTRPLPSNRPAGAGLLAVGLLACGAGIWVRRQL
ncbi:MAG: hypothetical protein NT154_47185 [Verrucomicrobia bacterium]|nr:hypothetical protein [Verrucomicrobiota bacterium]